ncbi:hypothetical protein [Ichthyenterobacterium magnum]|uniref:Uncharacterized protein n=1 Tax=Ichthyenterobacterium magnum TaxID=1230530 RepID=A0A420DGT3_9FLAO|nr:hypothetical protein [Ichthyenterobacterium magnum]RKE92294.1 hypothetical protein BXY80_2213 [Ichthyenterobacterium magnum]
MTNKITFFRFSNSKSYFDHELRNEQIKEKESLEDLQNYLDSHPNRKYRTLNEDENLALNKYNQVKNEFKTQLSLKDKNILDINNIDKRLLKSELNNNSIKQRLHIKIASEFNLEELNELILQKEYNYCFKRYEKSKKLVEQTNLHERIEIDDLNELNSIISDMNNNGWSIKQIEGIQSGSSYISCGMHEVGGGGYGYGFTQGIMIVWENNIIQKHV